MKTFVADIIPKIQRFSQKLDNQTLLTNQHWVVFDDIENSKNVYIFRSNNQLLISKNGRVEKGKWEIIGSNSILIDLEKESFLFKHGFFDQNILALKLDGKNEYAFLINEDKYSGELDSIEKILDFLNIFYLDKPMPLAFEKNANIQINMKSLAQNKDQLIKINTQNGVIYLDDVRGFANGEKVYANLNKEPAVDGKYEIGFMWYIHIKNGRIWKTTVF